MKIFVSRRTGNQPFNNSYSQVFSELGVQQKDALKEFLESDKQKLKHLNIAILSLLVEVGDLLFYLTSDKLSNKLVVGNKVSSALNLVRKLQEEDLESQDDKVSNLLQRNVSESCLIDFVTFQRPLVAYNQVQWLARKIAISAGNKQWYSAEKALLQLKKLLSKSDAEWLRLTQEHSALDGDYGELSVFRPVLKYVEGVGNFSNFSKSTKSI